VGTISKLDPVGVDKLLLGLSDIAGQSSNPSQECMRAAN
jgi:hypothetical protein